MRASSSFSDLLIYNVPRKHELKHELGPNI
jgi:hypothetical protein